jgi:hypothetical protein
LMRGKPYVEAVQMKSSLAIISLIVMFAAAQAADIPIQKGWQFSHAREVLIANGWKPVRNDFKMPDGTLERNFSPASEMSQAGYLEVENCSEGLVYCEFNYSRDGHCLQIITQGELLPDIGPRAEPKVVGWRNWCIHQRGP